MRRTVLGISMVLILAVAACSGSAPTATPTASPPTASPTPSPSPTESAPSPTASPSATALVEAATASPGASEVPVDTATPNLAAIKPCSLFTTADADALSGTKYKPGAAKTSGGRRVCTYAYLAARDSVAFALQVNPSPLAAQGAFTAATLDAILFSPHQVPGIGDGALIARINEFGIEDSNIYVLKGSYVFAISAISRPPGPADTLLESAAAAVVGRLP
jgi:hypothetical protein